MTFKERRNQLQRIHSLVKMKATGTPVELANKLAVSESSVYRRIQFLKEEIGAPILFDRDRGSYVYEGEFELIL